jgi:uncharacterized NAD-dependent epimerase/dehydratase family protein
VTSRTPEGSAIVYCEGAFATTNGKTAHGLVRRSSRYRILSVIDSTLAGADAGEILDHKANGVRIDATVTDAIHRVAATGLGPTHLVIGLAPDGGRLDSRARADVLSAIENGLNIDAGLHDFLADDPRLRAAAESFGVTLRDVRRPPPLEALHFFSGKIAQVESTTVALLGTDSAVGKRTTAWALVDELVARGKRAELVGTGQTAWMQGARFGVVMDSLVNDFVTGEIEHAVWCAWEEERPDVIVVEGQGSLMNPAYPGGFEILAAARPDVVILQHAPKRRSYDGFPDFPLHPLRRQIEAIELVSGRPVVAVTINHEGMTEEETRVACNQIRLETGRPAVDVLLDGPGALVDALRAHLGSVSREVAS